MLQTGPGDPRSFEDPSLGAKLSDIQGRKLLWGLALGPIPLYLLGVMPGALHLIYVGAHGFLQHSVRGVLVFGVLFPLWLYVVLTRVSGCTLTSLNLKRGRWWRDIALGFAVLLILVTCQGVFNLILRHYFPFHKTSVDINLNRRINSSLSIFLIWLGPRIWLGAAIGEEFARTFFLSHCWKIYRSPAARSFAVIISGILFGLLHIYQGWGAVVVLMLVGCVYALIYGRLGRVLPLIVAHGLLDDSLQTLRYLYAHGYLHK
jgi:hypothetical protein